MPTSILGPLGTPIVPPGAQPHSARAQRSPQQEPSLRDGTTQATATTDWQSPPNEASSIASATPRAPTPQTAPQGPQNGAGGVHTPGMVAQLGGPIRIQQRSSTNVTASARQTSPSTQNARVAPGVRAQARAPLVSSGGSPVPPPPDRGYLPPGAGLVAAAQAAANPSPRSGRPTSATGGRPGYLAPPCARPVPLSGATPPPNVGGPTLYQQAPQAACTATARAWGAQVPPPVHQNAQPMTPRRYPPVLSRGTAVADPGRMNAGV